MFCTTILSFAFFSAAECVSPSIWFVALWKSSISVFFSLCPVKVEFVCCSLFGLDTFRCLQIEKSPIILLNSVVGLQLDRKKIK